MVESVSVSRQFMPAADAPQAWLLIWLELTSHTLGVVQAIEQHRSAAPDAAAALVRASALGRAPLAALAAPHSAALASLSEPVVGKKAVKTAEAKTVPEAKTGVREATTAATANKRSARKRSVADLVNMDHPALQRGHWLQTFQAHVREIHRRGHRLSVRGVTMADMDAVEAAFDGSAAKFAVSDEAAALSEAPAPANVSYTQVPLNPKEIFEGLITGAAGMLVPGLREAENGTEALATFQQCFDPRKMHETFVIKDFFKAQDELPEISEADLDDFDASAMTADMDESTASALLRRFDQIKAKTWKTWKYMSAIMRKLAPYLLQLLKHAYRCGVVDLVLGVALGFLLPFFPPMLLLLVAVGGMAFELITQVMRAIENWYKNWFKFGKAIGAILAFLTMLVVAYKMGKSKSVECRGKGRGCSYEMPKNEMNNWQPPKAQRHCGGMYCNPVYRRDDIIDPYLIDDLGRTNVERMKAGSAAIGPDGSPINLHHIHQTPDGPIAELTDTFHSVNHKELHKFLKPGEPSRINRDAFGVWRSSYWRNRGREMEAALQSGEYAVQFGKAVANWAPVAAVSLTKSWDAVADGVPSVGDFLGRVIDAITDGESDSNVTSVKDGLFSLDAFRLLLRALRGKAVDSANDDDARMSAVGESQRADPMVRCSLDAMCTDSVSLDGARFERVDGEIENEVEKRYTVHFAPDTGYALSLSAFVAEGGTHASVRRANADADAELLAGDGVREPVKHTLAGELVDEFGNATHRVTLQHCDGYGDYEITLRGERPAADPSTWASPSANETVRQFWAENGGPPEPTRSIFSVGAQYVPYPRVPSGARVSLVAAPAAAADAARTLSVPLAEGAARYHVFLAPVDAPQAATVCDVMRVAVRATTVDARVEAPPAGATAINASLLPEERDTRAYVVAESDGGAMTLMPSASTAGETGLVVAGVESGGLGGGAIAAIVLVPLLLCIALLGAALFIKKKREAGHF